MDPHLPHLESMGDVAADSRAPALRGAVPRAVGVPAHAAAAGECGEGAGVSGDPGGVPLLAPAAGPDPVGWRVAGGAAGRGGEEEGDGQRAVHAAYLGVLRAACGGVEWGEDAGWVKDSVIQHNFWGCGSKVDPVRVKIIEAKPVEGY